MHSSSACKHTSQGQTHFAHICIPWLDFPINNYQPGNIAKQKDNAFGNAYKSDCLTVGKRNYFTRLLHDMQILQFHNLNYCMYTQGIGGYTADPLQLKQGCGSAMYTPWPMQEHSNSVWVLMESSCHYDPAVIQDLNFRPVLAWHASLEKENECL